MCPVAIWGLARLPRVPWHLEADPWRFRSQFRKAAAGRQLSIQTRQPPSYQHLPQKHTSACPSPGAVGGRGGDSVQRIRVPRNHNHNNNTCWDIF